LIDPEALREDLPRFAGDPGVRPLRHLLDKLFFRLSDSDLEIYFRRIVKAAGLPMPLAKQWVNKFEVDFFWPDLGLVVETDGLRYHRTPFTHYEVRTNPTASARRSSGPSRCFGSATDSDHSLVGRESDTALEQRAEA
jgi:hypothetical protein